MPFDCIVAKTDAKDEEGGANPSQTALPIRFAAEWRNMRAPHCLISAGC